MKDVQPLIVQPKVQSHNQRHPILQSLSRTKNAISVRSRKFSFTPGQQPPVLLNNSHSFLNLNEDKYLSDVAQQISHPLTPHAQLISDIPSLINRTLKYMNYKVYQSISSKNNANVDNKPESRKKMETLGNILALLQDPVLKHSLDDNVIESLVNLVNAHIFRSIGNYVMDHEYSEFSTKYSLTNWEHIHVIYRIFNCLLLHHSCFSRFISSDFARKIVNQLRTPIDVERDELEKVLKKIVHSYPNQRQPLMQCMLSAVIRYLDTQEDAVVIAPILRCFYDYFLSLKPPIKAVNFTIFQSVLYPLYATSGFKDFENVLMEMSMIFQVAEPNIAFWCLKYLHNHWPKSDPKKEGIFLRHLTNLLPLIPSDVIGEAMPIIALDMSKGIGSDSFATAAFCITFCNDDGFLGVFQSYPELIGKYLAPAAKRATKYWKQDVKEYAINLYSRLQEISGVIEDDSEKDKYKNWKSILRMASKKYTKQRYNSKEKEMKALFHQ